MTSSVNLNNETRVRHRSESCQVFAVSISSEGGPRLIMRHTFFTAGVVAFAAFGASLASATPVATPIPSSLNCPIAGGSACASSPGSYGSLTFTNAGANTVDIGVSLNGGAPLSIQDIFLNYNEAKFNSTSMFTATVTGASPTVTNSENGLTVNGSGNYPGKFDLSISKLTQGGPTSR
jgi:hypothetical protein